MHHIGIDLGGTKIEGVVIADKQPKALAQVHEKTLAKGGSYEQVLQNIAGVCRKLLRSAGDAFTIGLCLPGMIDERGIMNGGNILCLQQHPIKADLEALVGHEITFINDANSFALSEAHFGAGRGYGVVAGITIGTGLGSGVVIDGQLLTGSRGFASEWGHICAVIGGYPCWCGRTGCFEQYVSGTGLNRIYREKGGADLRGTQVYERYCQGEDIARQSMEEFMQIFSSLLMDLCAAYDPDIIVVGGGLSSIDMLYDKAHWQPQTLSSAWYQSHITVLRAQLGPTAGVYGAALAPIGFTV